MAETNFDRAFTDLLGNEGGYSNHPNDPGGETMWGITAGTARRAGYTGPMKTMPVEVARKIYRERYWNPAFDRMPYEVAFQCFDAAVNSGPVVAVRWLQEAVGVAADGIIGPVTMAAVAKADPLAIVISFNAARLSFLTSLPTWATFGRGWANRIVGNLLKAVG
ncbi:glycosyl hydrolase 108 family protein [Desulfobulbus sp.]|uniref:glycoside hydrolase family 108 protein n=1 Tax=Desulfobulbus sp. TaxID=895 RepID=UPI00286F7D78|nr:glycosyl hydrolase 108 family protein [Desulfobulbus sp.]